MDYKVVNKSNRAKALRVVGGFKTVKSGAEGTIENAIELSEDQIDALAAVGCKVSVAGEAKKPEPKPEPKPKAPAKAKSEPKPKAE